ncbi:hypothetical protein SAMD00019534_028310 [Acytostelium subglobosum LB1]|uniref:hypothetical protein n=1 Tax=Acytostelium subglobosum LB1 TaxID=1410327 RepID=UPI00064488E5|nr:hypothetical protein SAMD00019534_028310 [Acytostelium subglobosum LB1]GAM19656.1 hypothetical protein SAMD00019534_028310 [Acytostelium subglobosum LB1]|eukprot:XP_012756418.1 hypothetical protein SAMD00019534_028310 [Acytostelium subglobosum LB1]
MVRAVDPVYIQANCDANKVTIPSCASTPSGAKSRVNVTVLPDICVVNSDWCNDAPIPDGGSYKLISNNGSYASFNIYNNQADCAAGTNLVKVFDNLCNSCDPKSGQTIKCSLKNSASALASFGMVTVVGVVATLMFL